MKQNSFILRLSCMFVVITTLSGAKAQTNSLSTNIMSESDSVASAYNMKKTDPSTIDFHLVYIAHEPYPATPSSLCSRLARQRRDAAETGNILIVYLANEDEPLLSFTNIADPDSTLLRDSLAAFNDIIDAIQDIPSHEPNAMTDISQLKGLIGIAGTYPIFDESGNEGVLRYNSVTIDFYVGPRFWNLRYNDNIIAQLYSILRLSKYMKQYPRKKLQFNVYYATGQTLKYPEGMPFGIHNKDGINDNPKVQPKQY